MCLQAWHESGIMKLDTFETLRQIISDKFDKDASEITRETNLDSLGIDSLHAFDIIFEAEEKYGIKIPFETVPIQTVQDIVDLIDKMRVAQGD